MIARLIRGRLRPHQLSLGRMVGGLKGGTEPRLGGLKGDGSGMMRCLGVKQDGFGILIRGIFEIKPAPEASVQQA